METLIILHGWKSARERWQSVKEKIERHEIKVIIPDLPGFKKENEPNEIWNLNDYLDWTKDFIDRVTKEPIFLLGHSFGGRIAIKFAAKYPERLKALILVSAAGIKREKLFFLPKTKPFFSILSCFRFLPGYQFFRKIFYRYIIGKTDYLEVSGLMKETFKKIIKEDLTSYLSQIYIPTLIIWGERDKITPLSDAYLMKKEISNSTLEIIPKADHRINFTAPEKLSEITAKFLKKIR